MKGILSEGFYSKFCVSIYLNDDFLGTKTSNSKVFKRKFKNFEFNNLTQSFLLRFKEWIIDMQIQNVLF